MPDDTMKEALEQVKGRSTDIAKAMVIQGKEHPSFTSPRVGEEREQRKESNPWYIQRGYVRTR